MMTFFIVLAAAAQAYLLGSVDTGILVSKYLYHDDVRNHGSGAAGMTNMLRTFGKKAAALTAAGDVLKGVAAVCIGRWLFGFLPADAAVSPYLGVYLTAILAVVGHTKPIYFGFKGQGRAGGGRCHPGGPAHSPAGVDRRFSALPCPHRHGVAGQHCNGGILSGADPYLRPAQGLRR